MGDSSSKQVVVGSLGDSHSRWIAMHCRAFWSRHGLGWILVLITFYHRPDVRSYGLSRNKRVTSDFISSGYRYGTDNFTIK